MLAELASLRSCGGKGSSKNVSESELSALASTCFSLIRWQNFQQQTRELVPSFALRRDICNIQEHQHIPLECVAALLPSLEFHEVTGDAAV